MKILLQPDSAVVFDLDDTLYPERDFLRSGYREIAALLPEEHRAAVFLKMFAWWEEGFKDVFQRALDEFPFACGMDELLDLYRHHTPSILLRPGVEGLLQALKEKEIPVGLITDGRSRTQRAKLAALGLTGFFDVEIISEELGSEKPDLRNFQTMAEGLDAQRFMYIADNTRKDFIAPNQLGWMSICLLDNGGENIHPQKFDGPATALPTVCIDTLSLDNFSFLVDL